MSSEAQHFATVVLDAFRDAQLFSAEQIASAGGPSTTTITKLRKAREGGPLAKPRGDTMRKIETAARWPDRSASVLWETGALPDADVARAIGSGGVPAPEVFVQASRSSVDRSGEEIAYLASTVALDRQGNESKMEIRYTPGDGREVTLMDLGPVASIAHREAVRVTYMTGTRPRITQLQQEGGGGHADDPALDKTPAPGPADQPGLELLTEAARRNPKRPRRGPREQEAD